MATEQNLTCVTFLAAGDLSTKQYYLMKLSDADTVDTQDAAGGICVGALQNKPSAAGEAATVAVYGVTKVVASAALTAPLFVKATAAGKIADASEAVVDTSDSGIAADPVIGSNVFGLLLDDAGADGDVVRVLITHSGAIPTTAA